MNPYAAITAEQMAELQKRFSYHAPTGDQPQRYTDLRAAAKSFAIEVLARVPAGREQALALTNIEQAVMWANAGVARNPVTP